PWINNLKTWIFDTGIGTSPTPCLTMSIFKYGNPIFVNFTIVNNMVANEWYTVDILDEAYGINNEKIEPFTLSITATENWESESFGYKVSPIDQSHLMGSLQFNSNNKYWIQQNYYYQQGGVFLEQPGEGMVAKVMPLISVTNQTGIPTV